MPDCEQCANEIHRALNIACAARSSFDCLAEDLPEKMKPENLVQLTIEELRAIEARIREKACANESNCNSGSRIP